MPMDSGLVDKELRLQEEVMKLSFQEKIQLQQRAKCTWLKDGNRCSKFFHATVRARQPRNFAAYLLYAEEKLASDDRAVVDEAIKFYMSLYNQVDYL
ncbi:uncharacterized protein M6B38_190430 [Iris pallida]|uniref:RNA-directed DNA polymerase (Reverse transcriptase) n=1 Tax=Iris pallida TaxID=29817 RepID=A0AAX6EG49_IRIPA|nr:uncharacterized protein M6B38_190430 [Iris pallida]